MSEFSFSDTDQVLWLSHFNSAGVFIGSGLTIIPANTGLPANTTLERCEPPAGETGIWDGGAWRYVKDTRGVRYWDKYGHGSVIVDINDAIPMDAIFTEPPKKETGFVLLFNDGDWHKIEDKTGVKYYEKLGQISMVPSPYFVLPDGCTFIAPPESQDGYVTQWDGMTWQYVEDHRGTIAYEKANGDAKVIDYIGPINDEYTLLEPGSRYDVWDGNKWVLDDKKLKARQIDDATLKRASLRSEADSMVSTLGSAVKLGVATEAERAALEMWELYRIALLRIDVNAAPDIEWPVKP